MSTETMCVEFFFFFFEDNPSKKFLVGITYVGVITCYSRLALYKLLKVCYHRFILKMRSTCVVHFDWPLFWFSSTQRVRILAHWVVWPRFWLNYVTALRDHCIDFLDSLCCVKTSYWWFLFIIDIISKLTSKKTNEFINNHEMCPRSIFDKFILDLWPLFDSMLRKSNKR